MKVACQNFFRFAVVCGSLFGFSAQCNAQTGEQTTGSLNATAAATGGTTATQILTTGSIELLLQSAQTTVTLENGIKYQDLIVGDGPVTSAGMQCSIHFRLKLENETLLDNTETKMIPQPFTFLYDSEEVISGLNKGMAGMKIGGRRVIVIPPELAYGEEGRGPIPPNSTLVYDVRFVGMRKPKTLLD